MVSYQLVGLRSRDRAAYLKALCSVPRGFSSPDSDPGAAYPASYTVEADQVSERAERLTERAALDPDGRADTGEPSWFRQEHATGSRIHGLVHDR